MKKSYLAIAFALILMLLSGCAYPQEELAKNQTPYQDQLKAVQTAVDSYRKDNGGMLPIVTKDVNTPLYQRYPVDFKKISPRYIADPPGNAFENGGVFQYVLVNEETKPEVKLFDLRVADTIRELRLKIKMDGYPPFKKVIASDVYSLDYKKMGYKQPPMALSPFTQKKLPMVISGEGEIYIDYRNDLKAAIKNIGLSGYKPGDDIRPLLVNNSMFVPAYSVPYTFDAVTKEPVFLEKKNK